MRSLRKYAHILFIICVTVLAIRRISYTTQLNYIKRTFFPRSNYFNSLTIYGHPSPRVRAYLPRGDAMSQGDLICI